MCEESRLFSLDTFFSPRGGVTKRGKSLIQSKILESFFFAADIRRRRRRRKRGMLLYLHERMVRGGEVRPIFGWGGRCQKRWVSAKCSTTLYFPCGDVCCHWEAGSPKKKVKIRLRRQLCVLQVMPSCVGQVSKAAKFRDDSASPSKRLAQVG